MAERQHHAGRSRWLALGAAAGLAALLAAGSALAGGFRLEPGAATRIDTGERQTYTTITISNPDTVAGRLALEAPVGRVIDIPAGGNVELYGAYGRSTIAVTNTGASRLLVVTRYLETQRLP